MKKKFEGNIMPITTPRWLQTRQTNVGAVTFIEPPARVSNLRKPYQYLLTCAGMKKLMKDMKDMTSAFNVRNSQCSLVDSKAVSYGRKFGVWTLSFAPGFCGDNRGCTQEQWVAYTNSILKRLEKDLGEVDLYVEPWNSTRKFQMRFDTYVMYKELKP